MKLWLLKRPDNDVSWDEAEGFVVRAATAEAARLFAAAGAGDEGADCWKAADCIEVGPDGEPGVVLRAFNAG